MVRAFLLISVMAIPVALADPVLRFTTVPNAMGNLFWSPDGKSFWAVDRESLTTLVHHGVDGKSLGKVRFEDQVITYGRRTMSPDGKTIVVNRRPLGFDREPWKISLADLTRGTIRPLEGGWDGAAEWMADGKLVGKEQGGAVVVVDPKSGQKRPICKDTRGIERVHPTSDGKGLVLYTGSEVWVADAECGKLEPLVTPRNADGSAPKLVLDSPNRKRWLAVVWAGRRNVAFLVGPVPQKLGELHNLDSSSIGWLGDDLVLWKGSRAMLWQRTMAAGGRTLPVFPDPEHFSDAETGSCEDSYPAFSPKAAAMVYERHCGASDPQVIVARLPDR
jgi:hypothetical protein